MTQSCTGLVMALRAKDSFGDTGLGCRIRAKQDSGCCRPMRVRLRETRRGAGHAAYIVAVLTLHPCLDQLHARLPCDQVPSHIKQRGQVASHPQSTSRQPSVGRPVSTRPANSDCSCSSSDEPRPGSRGAARSKASSTVELAVLLGAIAGAGHDNGATSALILICRSPT